MPFMEIPWSWEQPIPLKSRHPPFRVDRVMTTDLGVINLTTSVICEAGSQIAPPIFWSPSQQMLLRMEHLYHLISRIQRKLDRYPTTWRGQGKR